MSKIKPILPSLREKKRYIAYEVISAKEVDHKKAITHETKSFLGELGLAKSNMMLIDHHKSGGVIKVNNKYVDHIKSALTLVRVVDSQNAIIKTIKVSGMLERAKKALILKGG